MWNLKIGTNKPIYKAEIESQMQKTNLWFGREKTGVGINWEMGIDIYTLLYMKQVANKNSTQCSVMTYMGTESKKEWVCVYV